jgi:hypothetical protein
MAAAIHHHLLPVCLHLLAVFLPPAAARLTAEKPVQALQPMAQPGTRLWAEALSRRFDPR